MTASNEETESASGLTLIGVALTSASLLIAELALTRIFSVTMYYHFAFLAISIALFGLSASGVWVFIARRSFAPRETLSLLACSVFALALAILVSSAFLTRIRVGLTYSPTNLFLMVAIYLLAALPFFAGGTVLAFALSRLRKDVTVVYGADLLGAAAGCLLLVPLINLVGAPGALLAAAALSGLAAICFAPSASRRQIVGAVGALAVCSVAAAVTGVLQLDIRDAKGHVGDNVVFSKWNSFSRVAVYGRSHGDWALSTSYHGGKPDSRFMDIDSAASTPILRFNGRLDEVEYLKFDLTALAHYLFTDPHLKPWAAPVNGATATEQPGVGSMTSASPPGGGLSPVAPYRALVIGPGGGRDLLSALVFGAEKIDGIEVNPIIATDVMNGAFRDFSGSIYQHPRVHIAIDDGRSFIRRSPERYDLIQASLVDTWAATAAGAYTLTENSLYTVEAFDDYLDHLTPNGVLTITRWVFDGLRLISLAQEACLERGLDAAKHLAVVQHGRLVNVILKRTPFSPREIEILRLAAAQLKFDALYIPQPPSHDVTSPIPVQTDRERENEYRSLILSDNRPAFYDRYVIDVRPVRDDRPFFFHTTKLRNQLPQAFGRSMLFGNGLSALLTLMGISAVLVILCIIGPLALTAGTPGHGWAGWLAYFSALGAGFMLIEVALLQRFVLLLGHPVYSLAVTLTSLLVGTGLGSLLSRRIPDASVRRGAWSAIGGVILVCAIGAWLLPGFISLAMPLSRGARILMTVVLLVPTGILLGIPLPSGLRLLAARAPAVVPWAWGLNGACSVVGTTFAVFLAMNWGFSVALLVAAATYAAAALTLLILARTDAREA